MNTSLGFKMDRKTQRSWVFKIIYQLEFNTFDRLNLSKVLAQHQLEASGFIYDSILSILDNLTKIDALIDKYTLNQSQAKISKVDQAILRTSINEFAVEKSVPVSVSINEAVELAKMYSKDDAYKFINGVLSSVAKDLP